LEFSIWALVVDGNDGVLRPGCVLVWEFMSFRTTLAAVNVSSRLREVEAVRPGPSAGRLTIALILKEGPTVFVKKAVYTEGECVDLQA
jgi:hypothetical protein